MEKSVSPSPLNATTNGHTPVKRGFRRQKTRTTKKSGHTGEASFPTVNMMKGIESLVKEEAESDLTMLDWYVAFAMVRYAVLKTPFDDLPWACFNLAEEMMKERKKRMRKKGFE